VGGREIGVKDRAERAPLLKTLRRRLKATEVWLQELSSLVGVKVFHRAAGLRLYTPREPLSPPCDDSLRSVNDRGAANCRGPWRRSHDICRR